MDSSLPTRSLSRAELVGVDCVLALLLAGGYLLAARTAAAPAGLAWWAWPLVLAMALPVAVRRLWPQSVFSAVTVASMLALSLGVLHEPLLAVALTAYTAAVAGRRPGLRGWRILVAASLVLLLISVSAGMASSWWWSPAVLLPGLGLVAALWTAGAATRERRAYAERSSEERRARAVADERLRIAREVHDIVSHALGVIAVKAAVARHVAPTRPDVAQDALAVIDDISRVALAEMRQALHLLRAGEDGAGGPPPDVGLPALVSRVAAAGLDVECELVGLERLPEPTAVSTFRIVQEALSNVLKHAGRTRCRVTVSCGADEVVIDVQDDGPAGLRPAAGACGHGLRGMRERVALHGGDFQAGPLDRGRGFRVHARLPYGPDGASPA